MLDWLLTSRNGTDEAQNGNNHETYYWARVGLYGLWLGKNEAVRRMCDNYRSRIVPLQIEPDGAMMRELGRTNSLHYSLYNLAAMAYLCEVAHFAGEDLWSFTVRDRSIEKAIDFHTPALRNPFTWKFQMLRGSAPSDQLSLQLGAMRLNRPDLAGLNRRLRADRKVWRGGILGPMCLLPGYDFDEWDPAEAIEWGGRRGRGAN
jgi:hypothetical protein